MNGNQFSNLFNQNQTFDRESHLKSKDIEERKTSSISSSSPDEQDLSENDQGVSSDENLETCEPQMEKDQEQTIKSSAFHRRFRNIDQTTCWLNSCLQLILTAFDYCLSPSSLTSELGKELMHLKSCNQNIALDPSNSKNIIVTAEDTRIATRLSEMPTEVLDPIQLNNRRNAIEGMRLDLISGQQCVRDFFLCINENVLNWPDVYSNFGFKMTHSTRCCSCMNVNQSETTQIYVEIPVPPNNSNLNECIEDYFNTSSLEGLNCLSELCTSRKAIKVNSIR